MNTPHPTLRSIEEKDPLHAAERIGFDSNFHTTTHHPPPYDWDVELANLIARHPEIERQIRRAFDQGRLDS